MTQIYRHALFAYFCFFQFLSLYGQTTSRVIHIGSYERDEIVRAAESPNGNMILSGYFSDTLFFRPGSYYIAAKTTSEAYIAAIDKDGVPQWHQTISGAVPPFLSSVTTDHANNIYAGGYFSREATLPDETVLSSPQEFQPLLLKFSQDGSFLWYKTFPSNGFSTLAGLAADNEGNVYAAVQVNGDTVSVEGVKYPTLKKSAVVIKYDSDGNLKWARFLSSPSAAGLSAGAGDR
ncbi:MAG: hypothetical protein M3Q97_06660 [Bacteroidota bacterium]|nr:hypothetical protein [Bacteroidota bacterium]